MKRIKKALLLPVRSMAYRWKCLRLFYWADRQLYDLRAVCVMPHWYYRRLFHVCLWLVAFYHFKRLADRAIHTIPYHVRFQMA